MEQRNSHRQGDLFSHAAKRRRVEAASNTLSKPFRSPFKAATKLDTDRECSTLVGFAGSSDEKQQARPLVDRRIQFNSSTTQTRVNFSKEPMLYHLLKEERQLEQELRELKSELDTVEQARKIETKDKDEELAGLIEKWKGAARTAAEEVFGRVSDRVNRYGSHYWF
jgi:Swi5-dependent recombination DNA repair protein 1